MQEEDRCAAQLMQLYQGHEVDQSHVTSIWTTLTAMMHDLCCLFKLGLKLYGYNQILISWY